MFTLGEIAMSRLPALRHGALGHPFFLPTEIRFAAAVARDTSRGRKLDFHFSAAPALEARQVQQ